MTACCQLALRPATLLLRTMAYMLRLVFFTPSSLPVQATLLACALWSGSAGVAAAPGGDPPARVGHASVLGDALEFSKDGELWEPAAVGAPLTTHSAVRNLTWSRAELRIGSTALRLAPQVWLQFEQLDDAGVVVALNIGRLNVRLRQCCRPGDTLAVLLDGARFDATSAGSFHLDVDARGLRATVRVYAGSGRLTVGDQRLTLNAGQQVRVNTQTMTVVRQGPAERNPIDDWADERDAAAQARAEGGGTALYAPAEMTGAALLDDHGAWRTDPRWGPVWFPRGVAADWAPYRQGRWAWILPWGWTWIDDAPWGFAPFHYGRWVFLTGRWGWLPGDAQARPVYAAALVGFYGTPPAGWGLVAGVPVGAVVGWHPLGQGEFYRPPGNPSAAYVQALNVPHVQAQTQAVPDVTTGSATSKLGNYRYAQTSFAATVVPRAVFEGGQAVAPARLNVAPSTLAGAPALGSAAVPAGPGPAPRAMPQAQR
jgi:hypothetical protein